ncbi:unnamed protein product [Macrosiphum euphorbiae]|uniref:Uncharacterized protein n=1 Tax=Macrosiphum euphorbiae TaxID=13131 RepID=A0AAV0VZ70_9HEMI|nr:unnamed protein product [Macrosiphum euphorbiae]
MVAVNNENITVIRMMFSCADQQKRSLLVGHNVAGKGKNGVSVVDRSADTKLWWLARTGERDRGVTCAFGFIRVADTSGDMVVRYGFRRCE